MLGVNDVSAEWCSRSSSKRRRLMPTCFGGKTAIEQSLMRVDGQQASVASVLCADATAAATARENDANMTQTAVSTYQLMYRQCSRYSVTASEQVRRGRTESRVTSMTTVSRCHSAMTSDERHRRRRAAHRTSCEDSGYEETQCEHSSTPAQLTRQLLSRGSVTVF